MTQQKKNKIEETKSDHVVLCTMENLIKSKVKASKVTKYKMFAISKNSVYPLIVNV